MRAMPHPGGGQGKNMTIHEIVEQAIAAINRMTPDQKAIARARLIRSLCPDKIKTAGGKPE